MNMQDFIEKFAEAIEMESVDGLKEDTRFRELEEWNSLAQGRTKGRKGGERTCPPEKEHSGQLPGNLFHAGGLDRPTTVICQPYHPRKTNEDSNRYRRTQGNRQQLCRKYPAPAFRPVSGRDKRTVRKQI